MAARSTTSDVTAAAAAHSSASSVGSEVVGCEGVGGGEGAVRWAVGGVVTA